MTLFQTTQTSKQHARFVSTTCLLTIVVLVALFTITCQDGAKQIVADDDTSTLYHLAGVVLDYQTNLPVAEVTVEVVADSTYRAKTDPTGHYSLTIGADPGVYDISFRGNHYAMMSGKISLPDDSPPPNGAGKPALSPNQILVTNDVSLYPLSTHVTGTVLGCFTWDIPDWSDDTTGPSIPPPRPRPLFVYITYEGIGESGPDAATLVCNLYTAEADHQGNYEFQNIPHTDSAFIGIIPFFEIDSFYYGSQSVINFDDPEPVDIQLESPPMYDAMYIYNAFDTLRWASVSGWFGMTDPDATGHFTGEWSIRKNDCYPQPTDMGPQEGNGLLTGRIIDGIISIELNPDMADNNVTLVADTSSNGLRGTWHYSNFTGKVNRGPFEASRKTLGP